MQIKNKIILILAVILTALLIWDIYNQLEKKEKVKNGLLSPGIYLGIYKEKNSIISNLYPLELGLRKYIEKENLNVSIYFTSLRNGNNININGDKQFYPLSLSKLPIAILIMRKIEEGKLSLDAMLKIEEEDKIYSYDGLYNTTAKELPVNILMEDMLKKSDNTAFKVLSKQIEEEDINRTLDYFSFNLIPYNNWSKPAEEINTQIMSNMLLALYHSTVLKKEDSEYILKLLSESIFDIREISSLPEEVKIAHKWGENNDKGSYHFHDCGIIYLRQARMAYCVMTKDMDREKAINLISLIMRSIYEYQESEDSLSEIYKKRDNIGTIEI